MSGGRFPLRPGGPDKARRRWTIVMEELYGGMREQQRPNPRRIGDPGAIFKSCDLIVLTDAALNEPYYQIMFEKGEDEVEVEVQEPRERQNFPETWLWLSVSTGQSNTWETTVVVPDSITTWRATAFVMSENLGLGVLDTPAELTVFQEFFISLNLPAFIIRGEELVLEVNVYNYLSQDLIPNVNLINWFEKLKKQILFLLYFSRLPQRSRDLGVFPTSSPQVMVTVAQSDAFEFIFPDSDVLSMASSRKVFVPSDSSTPILFPIRPLALGVMPISVKAISSTASDAVRRDVVVKAEGLPQYYSTTLFVEMPFTGPKVLEFVFPADVVVGSERAVLTVMPYGCGEQNMIRFAPNIYIIDYLSASGQSDPETVAKATLYMQKGYERELSYQRLDGSFSAFGERDSSGSTWLSAFVLRCFLQARPYIPIDPNVLGRTAAWLVLQKDVDGRFLEPGRVIHTELQGGLDGPASLTAYVLMALLQDAGIQSSYTTQVTEALLYLETRLDAGISSNYSLCLVTYALALSGRPSATSAWDALLGRAQMHDGVPSWTSSSPGLARSWQPRTADIEMAAYAVLTLHKLGRIADAIPIIKWLSQQRNHLGGIRQHTALSQFASLGGAGMDLTITVTAGAFVPVATFFLDQTNYMVQQSQQLNVFYNIDNAGLARRKRELGDEEAFHLNIELFDGGSQSAHLSICVSPKELRTQRLGTTNRCCVPRLVDQQDLDQTGMALLEVGLLSGFTLAQQGVQTDSNIKNVEEEPGKIFVYLDSVSRAELCVEIPLFVEFKVAKVQRASVEIIDYYEPRRRTARSYTSDYRQNMDSCTFCGPNCDQCKVVTANTDQHPPLLALLVCPLLVIMGYGV
ncbi:CD109 antigen [Merluccius polli]|uniref:CD109 antigen n=1 Tax=Merluccius polli TaxID=89951 RepID=A0AA47M3L1_MERPO|nr:CD109 antigen [Merluccius polli]